MILIPDRTTKKLVQTNRGNILGNLWSTFNIDLQSNPGAFRVGKRMKINTSGVTNQGLSVGFELFDGRYFTVAGTRIFKNTANNLITQFAADASSGAVTTYDADYSDIIVFNSTLVASIGATKIYSKAADTSGTGAWTDRGGSLSSSVPHMMAYFKKFDRLYITNDTSINSVDTSWVVTSSTGNYFLSLGNNSGRITCIVATSDAIFIGTQRDSSCDLPRDCAILEWDGISAGITREYKIPAAGILSLVLKNNIPFAMDSNGRLRQFTGSDFKEVARLPVADSMLGLSINTGNSSRFIHPRGMCITEDDTILMLICNRNLYLTGSTENVNENLPSGIWEYDPKTGGLSHKNPITLMSMSSVAVTDYGQNRISKAGALCRAKFPEGTSSGMSSFVCGVEYYSDATTTVLGIFIDSPSPTNNAVLPEGQKLGYFVTDWIWSQNVQDSWSKIYTKYRQLLDSGDIIAVKYRTREAVAIEIGITWVNTTSFTTTTDVSALVGYEVEGLQGTGSGKCVHISAVTGSGTYTVTLDEVVTGVTTGTATARVQAWKKFFIINDQTSESKIKSLDKSSERIQLKICMQFKGDDEFFELGIVNVPHQQLQ